MIITPSFDGIPVTAPVFAQAALAFLAMPGIVAFCVPVIWAWRAHDTAIAHPAGLVLVLAGTAGLLWCVRDFYVSGKGTLAPWAPPRDLVVVGPEYVETDVDVDVSVGDSDAAGEVTAALTLSIDAFLNPLFGGTRGEGWRLGELPDRSDLYALCASIPGVTWVDSLRVTYREERAGTLHSRQFLACSGRHRVAVRFTRERALSRTPVTRTI